MKCAVEGEWVQGNCLRALRSLASFALKEFVREEKIH